MKKLFGLLIIGGLVSMFGFTFGQNSKKDFYADPNIGYENNENDNNNNSNSNTTTPTNTTDPKGGTTAGGKGNIPDNNSQNEAMGITMNETCILNGQCKFDIYKFLGIRKDIPDNNSPELFVQDILLSATFFIGTVVTLALIVSGLMFVFAGATGKDPSNAKAGIKNSFIGLLLVVCSYSIIRIVQYIAKGV